MRLETQRPYEITSDSSRPVKAASASASASMADLAAGESEGARPRVTVVVRAVSLRFHQPTSRWPWTTTPPPASANEVWVVPQGWSGRRGKLLLG